MPEGFADKLHETLSRQASQKKAIFAKIVKAPIQFSSCYICGSHKKKVFEIRYGNTYNYQTMMLCDDCKKWLGKFLISDEQQIMADMPESEEEV